MAGYCDASKLKEARNGEHKACLNDRALRLLDGFSSLFTVARSLKSQRLQLKEDFDIVVG